MKNKCMQRDSCPKGEVGSGAIVPKPAKHLEQIIN